LPSTEAEANLDQEIEVKGAHNRAHPPHLLFGSLTTLQFSTVGRDVIKDMIAGSVAAVVLIGNIVSFGALMFPGDLHSGLAVVIWAMLIGSCIGGGWIAAATSLPPIASGIDSPTGAVLVLLSASAGADVLAAGGTPDSAVQTVMLLFTAATVLSGALLYGLGKAKWGSYFRFVPYFVVGGFLTATGWFLIAGGVRMTSGHALSLAGMTTPWKLLPAIRLAAATGVVAVLLAVRQRSKSAFAIPFSLIAMWAMGALVLGTLGLSGGADGFYLPSLGTLTRWSPFHAARESKMTWPMIAELVPQLLTVTIVALISMVTKVSSIEVGRQTYGDLDCEFRAHGLASLMAAPLGGIASGLQVGTSRLLEHAGGATRMSGVFCALALGAVAISNFDLPGLIPIPIIAGLIFYLGYTFIVDALGRPFSQRAWFDLGLVTAMAIVCIRLGFLVGIVVGLICACVLFAISYARRGVVRRHITRADFSSYVERSAIAADFLRKNGAAIQLYWLSGYIFFGSSESVFERIRADVMALGRGCVKYVILDFGTVSGADASAVVSFNKLRNFCNQQGCTIIYCGLSAANRAVLQGGGLIGGKNEHKALPDLAYSLAWCEDELLAVAGLDCDAGEPGFAAWLQREMGSTTDVPQLLTYLDRKDVAESQVLYQQGEPANTIDLVAAGNLAVDVVKADGTRWRVRRIMTYRVVGEMGFFRRTARAATVSSDGTATLFTLTRDNFERMRIERPALAASFDDFILRVLADRVDFANHAITALST
jgi:SulP family sulfate permease